MTLTGIGTEIGPATKRSRRVSAVLIIVALVVSACGGQTQSPEGSSSTGGELIAAIGNLGTHEWSPARTGHDNEKISMMIQDSLIRLNTETRQFEGHLLESWSLSDDGTTWTFTLRPDIPFHDDWGTLTSEDVKFTWEQWISEDSTHNTAPLLAQAIDGDLDNFEIVSDLEFRLHTTTPIVHLLGILCSCDSGFHVSSKRYHDEMGEEANDHPIGTGPWKFVSSTPGVEVVLEAVDDHWYQSPSFDRLVLQEIPDPAARLVQVQSGAVDIAQLDASLTGEALAAELTIDGVPDVGNVFVILGGMYPGHPNNDDDSPWIQTDNPEAGKAIREALSLAIDRQLIIDTVLSGAATPVHGPLLPVQANPASWDPSWELPAYDLEAARAKLAEGGYPDGFPITLFMYPDDVDTISIAEAIAGMWEELGIEVTRDQSEEDLLDEMLNATQTDGIAWVKIAGLNGEPAQRINSYRSSREDDHKFFHDAIDDGYDRLSLETNEEERYAIARDITQALVEDVATITLFTADMPFVIGPDVASWDPIPGFNSISALETAVPAD